MHVMAVLPILAIHSGDPAAVSLFTDIAERLPRQETSEWSCLVESLGKCTGHTSKEVRKSVEELITKSLSMFEKTDAKDVRNSLYGYALPQLFENGQVKSELVLTIRNSLFE